MSILCKLGLHRWRVHYSLLIRPHFLRWLALHDQPGVRQFGVNSYIVPKERRCTRCGKVRR